MSHSNLNGCKFVNISQLLHPFILGWDTYYLPINYTYCSLFNTKLVNSLVFYCDLKTFYLLQMYTLDIRKLVIKMYHKL